MNPYLTVTEAADYLQLHPKTIVDRINDGCFEAVKPARHWRIKRDSFLAWVNRISRPARKVTQ